MFNNYSHFLSTLQSKTIGHVLKCKQKGKRVFIDEIIRLTIMKMKRRMKNISRR